MLVLLDNSQISQLADAFERRPSEFEEFGSVWNAHGCRLALCRANLQEVAQGDDPEAFRRRLWLFGHFPVVFFGDLNPDDILESEIQDQVLRRLAIGSGASSSPYEWIRDKVFPRRSHKFLLAWLLEWGDEIRKDKEHREHSARFANSELDLMKVFKKATGRSKPKFPLKGLQVSDLIVAQSRLLINDPDGRERFEGMLERMSKCAESARSERQMLICVHDLKDLPVVEKAPTEDLGGIAFSRRLGEKRVLTYCRMKGHNVPEIREALRELDPYEMPGTSVSLAVERGRKKAPKTREAGDFLDVEYVLAAPYTDLAFVDRRTAGYLEQERKARGHLISPYASVHIRRSGDISRTMKDIDEVSTARQAGNPPA